MSLEIVFIRHMHSRPAIRGREGKPATSSTCIILLYWRYLIAPAVKTTLTDSRAAGCSTCKREIIGDPFALIAFSLLWLPVTGVEERVVLTNNN